MKNYDKQKSRVVWNWVRKRKIGMPLEELEKMVKITKELKDKEEAKSLIRAMRGECKYSEYPSVTGLKIIIENTQLSAKEKQEDFEWIIKTCFKKQKGYYDCFKCALQLEEAKGNKWLKRLFFYLYWYTEVRSIGSHYAYNNKELLDKITKECIERDLDEEIIEEVIEGKVRKEKFLAMDYDFSLVEQNQLIDYLYEIQNKNQKAPIQ